MSITDTTSAIGSTIAGTLSDAVVTAADLSTDFAHEAAGLGRAGLEAIGLIESAPARRRLLPTLLVLLGLTVVVVAVARVARSRWSTPDAAAPVGTPSDSSLRVA